jgi:hypothetical protein
MSWESPFDRLRAAGIVGMELGPSKNEKARLFQL